MTAGQNFQTGCVLLAVALVVIHLKAIDANAFDPRYLVHGQECGTPQSTSVCGGKHSMCIVAQDNSQRCLCYGTYYRTDDGSCRGLYNLKVRSVDTTTGTTNVTFTWTPPANPGRSDVIYAIKYSNQETQVTSIGGTITGLTPGKYYSFKIISSLPADSFYPVKSGPTVIKAAVRTKKVAHGQECGAVQSRRICDGTYSKCIVAQDNRHRCLCGVRYYRTDDGSCRGLSYLNVRSVDTTSEATNVTFTWIPPANPGRSNVTYTIKYNNQSTQATSTGGTITGLSPGTYYTFEIISSLLPDSYYPARSSPAVIKAAVKTKKVAHGQECGASQSTNVCDGTNSKCIVAQDNRHRCLCDEASYRTDSGSCRGLSNLKMRFVDTTSGTTSVTFTWTTNTNPGRSDISYTIKYNNQSTPATSTGGTVTGLTPGTYYNFDIISSLPADGLYPAKSGPSVEETAIRTTQLNQVPCCCPSCQVSDTCDLCLDNGLTNWAECSPSYYVAHGQECSASQSSRVCDETYPKCIVAQDNRHRCLCDVGYYRTDGGSCNFLYNLGVTFVEAVARDTTSVKFTWRAPEYSGRSDVNYTIKYNSQETPGHATGGAVTGLTPGTPYDFDIISSLPADNYYPVKYAGLAAQKRIWTVPAQPGPTENPFLISETPPVYRVAFQSSAGTVHKYEMKVMGHKITETKRHYLQGNSTSQQIQLEFRRLIPGLVYTYRLTAYNGNNDRSTPRQGKFRVPDDDDVPVGIIVSGVIAAVVVVVIVAHVAVVLCRRRHRHDPATK